MECSTWKIAWDSRGLKNGMNLFSRTVFIKRVITVSNCVWCSDDCLCHVVSMLWFNVPSVTTDRWHSASPVSASQSGEGPAFGNFRSIVYCCVVWLHVPSVQLAPYLWMAASKPVCMHFHDESTENVLECCNNVKQSATEISKCLWLSVAYFATNPWQAGNILALVGVTTHTLSDTVQPPTCLVSRKCWGKVLGDRHWAGMLSLGRCFMKIIHLALSMEQWVWGKQGVAQPVDTKWEFMKS